MQRASDRRAARLPAALALTGVLALGCGDKTPPPNPVCDSECQDGIALRAVREMMKFAFNMTFQMQPVGWHDLTTDKFLHGSARVVGNAEANSEQGVTEVNLTYVFTQAVYAKKDDDAKQNYVIGLNGTIVQQGKIAVQPSSPTSLKMWSESLSVGGKVYDPPIEYAEAGHNVVILQNGNAVSALFCDRDDAGTSPDSGPDLDGGPSPDGGPILDGGLWDGGVRWDGGPTLEGCRLAGFSF